MLCSLVNASFKNVVSLNLTIFIPLPVNMRARFQYRPKRVFSEGRSEKN